MDLDISIIMISEIILSFWCMLHEVNLMLWFYPGNEMAERMAYFGLSVNMVAFMFYVMHKPFSSSSNAVNNFLGISQVSSVLGGFIADAYLGRYWTIAIFTTIYLGVLAFTFFLFFQENNIWTPGKKKM